MLPRILTGFRPVLSDGAGACLGWETHDEAALIGTGTLRNYVVQNGFGDVNSTGTDYFDARYRLTLLCRRDR